MTRIYYIFDQSLALASVQWSEFASSRDGYGFDPGLYRAGFYRSSHIFPINMAVKQSL